MNESERMSIDIEWRSKTFTVVSKPLNFIDDSARRNINIPDIFLRYEEQLDEWLDMDYEGEWKIKDYFQISGLTSWEIVLPFVVKRNTGREICLVEVMSLVGSYADLNINLSLTRAYLTNEKV